MRKAIIVSLLSFLLIWVPTLQASPPCGVYHQPVYPAQQQYYNYQTYNNLVAVLPAIFVPSASYTIGYAYAPKEELRQEQTKAASDDKLDKILSAIGTLDSKISSQDARISALEQRVNSSNSEGNWKEPRLPQRAPEPAPKPKLQAKAGPISVGDVLAVACASCHQSPQKKGGFSYSSAESLTQNWKDAIVEQVASGKMPPRGSNQLTPEARRVLINYMSK
jgi:mono/diheme cytochrome c family protein